MIAVDTSAMMAVVLGETQARVCAEALNAEDELVISAMTMAEARVVALGRSVADVMERLIGEIDLTVVPATGATAARIQSIYRKWGKGFHPAALNLGDLFRIRRCARVWLPAFVYRRRLRQDRHCERALAPCPSPSTASRTATR